MIGIQQIGIIVLVVLIIFFLSPKAIKKFRKTSVHAIKEASEFRKDIKGIKKDSDDVTKEVKEMITTDVKMSSL